MAEEAAIEEKSQSIYDLYRLQEYEFAFINDDLQETFDNLCNLYNISCKSRDDLLKFAEMIERERNAK